MTVTIFAINHITKYEAVDQKENVKQEIGVSFQS
jgi:hypothetical protein